MKTPSAKATDKFPACVQTVVSILEGMIKDTPNQGAGT